MESLPLIFSLVDFLCVGKQIVYDVTNLDSFNHVKRWLDQFDERGPENAKKLLVGNKRDLTSSRAVEYQTAKASGCDGVMAPQCSAKGGCLLVVICVLPGTFIQER